MWEKNRNRDPGRTAGSRNERAEGQRGQVPSGAGALVPRGAGAPRPTGPAHALGLLHTQPLADLAFCLRKHLSVHETRKSRVQALGFLADTLTPLLDQLRRALALSQTLPARDEDTDSASRTQGRWQDWHPDTP